jgi:hypothetical protein
MPLLLLLYWPLLVYYTGLYLYRYTCISVSRLYLGLYIHAVLSCVKSVYQECYVNSC